MSSCDTTEPNGEGQSASHPGRHIIAFLVVTAFLNTMGSGVLSPVLPFIVRQYISNENILAIVVGWLVAVYALCQFVAAPGLGLLSDRFGRRPLLLICLLGSAIGYALFGLGFIVGPVLGGFASQFSYAAPVYIAAAIFVASVVWGYFNFPESLSKEHRTAHTGLAGLNPFKQLRNVFALPRLRWLLLVTFFFAFPFAMFASITAVLLKDNLGWTPVNIGLVYFVVGVGDIVMQGVLIGRFLPVFGEVKLLIGGLACEMLAYLLIGAIAFVPSSLFLWGGIMCYIVGSGLLEPSLGGLVSLAAGPRQQGIVQGGSQSVQSLARMLGPVGGGLLYAQLGHASPYWSGAVIVGLAILATFLALPSIRANQQKPDASQT